MDSWTMQWGENPRKREDSRATHIMRVGSRWPGEVTDRYAGVRPQEVKEKYPPLSK